MAGAGASERGLLGLGAGALIGDQLQGHEMKEDEQQQEWMRSSGGSIDSRGKSTD